MVSSSPAAHSPSSTVAMRNWMADSMSANPDAPGATAALADSALSAVSSNGPAMSSSSSSAQWCSSPATNHFWEAMLFYSRKKLIHFSIISSRQAVHFSSFLWFSSTSIKINPPILFIVKTIVCLLPVH